MRILIAAIGSRGDVQPMMALGLALRERGHDVTACVPPDYVEWAARLGLDAQPVGLNMTEFIRQGTAGVRGILHALREFPRMIRSHFPALEGLARDSDVMLGSTLLACGPSFAEKFSLRFH